jgi:hypothetical protein
MNKAASEFYQVGMHGDVAGKYFEKCHSNYHIDPRVEVKEFTNSDTRLSLMWVNNRVHAFVIETRTAFNDIQFINGMVDNQPGPEPIIP